MGGRLECVLVCGGKWHDFDHARSELLRMLQQHPLARTHVYDDYRAVERLGSADLLVTYTCDVRPDPSQQAALADFVAGGGRWLALHGTNAAIDPPSESEPRYSTPRALGAVAEVLGSQFLGHPPIAEHTIEVVDPRHPLVAGVEDFRVSDELYVCELHGDHRVLLETRFSGTSPGFVEGDAESDRHPVLYLHDHGAGTVCYFTLGHCRGRYDVQDLGIEDTGRTDRGSWVVPEFRTVLSRCLAWGLEGRLPSAPGTGS